jgi:hypothetical protein
MGSLDKHRHASVLERRRRSDDDRPTFEGGRPYSPSDLPDALRELDKMLPTKFVTTASAAPECLSGEPQNVLFLHNALVGYAYDAWVVQGSRFGQYLHGTFGLSPPSPSNADGYELYAEKTAIAWALCTYYKSKHDGGSLDVESSTNELRQGLVQLKRNWHRDAQTGEEKNGMRAAYAEAMQ